MCELISNIASEPLALIVLVCQAKYDKSPYTDDITNEYTPLEATVKYGQLSLSLLRLTSRVCSIYNTPALNVINLR